MIKHLLAFSALALALPVASRAALTSISMSGTTTTEQWTTLTSGNHPGYPGFPGTSAWPSPIASDTSASSSGDATLDKIANGTGGGPYPASSAIYYGGFSGDYNNPGGTLAVSDSNPLADLKAVVFQIEIGEAWTYDFLDGLLPALSFTTSGGTSLLGDAYVSSSLFDRVYNGTVTMPTGEEDIYINTYAILYDLSDVADPILSFDIQWDGVQHAQVYALQLDTSDTAQSASILPPSAVPEPTGASLALAGGLALLGWRRRLSNSTTIGIQ